MRSVTSNENKGSNRLFLIMILISLLLHLCFSLFFMGVRGRWLAADTVPLPEEPPEKRIEFELVDVPADAEPLEREVDSRYVSDRSARARDTHTDTSVPFGEAMSLGEFERLTEYGRQSEQNQPVEPVPRSDKQSQVDAAENRELLYARNKEEFFDSSFSSTRYSKEDRKPRPQRPRTQPSRPLRKNTKSRASDSGGFSLNTYDWDFAPYMQEVKIKIERNLYVPEAFRLMGLINGETRVRFRVYRDGHVENIEVLRTSGHESLMHSAVSSIKAAKPFRPLPDDFPTDLDYLEITAYYTFIIR